MKVDGQLSRLRRKLMVEGDLGAMAGRPPDRRPREGPVVCPHPGGTAREDLDLCLSDRDLEAGPIQLARDRQALLEGPDRLGRGLRLHPVEQAEPPPEGQGDREGAAAQGAEEGSAPQAGLR
jgi:hypothetical protein